MTVIHNINEVTDTELLHICHFVRCIKYMEPGYFLASIQRRALMKASIQGVTSSLRRFAG